MSESVKPSTLSIRGAEAVVIGASFGALDALSKILPALPPEYPLPVIVVVHRPSDRKSIMSELLQTKCRVPVREIEDKEPIESGAVYIAPPDYHVLVENDRRLSLSQDEAVQFSRPSIDVLFETAADVFADRLVGVILTGANNDGARGLKTIVDAGGVALVQRPELAEAAAMPLAALKACPEARQVSLHELVNYLCSAGAPV